MVDGVLDRSIIQNWTERGNDISALSTELVLLSELLSVDILDSVE
jgi:hypothetical protein